jgi:murein DD-endopeptidase MepM/ murein hydrolase activator NlpD
MPKPIRKTEFVTVRKIPESGYHVVGSGETIYRIAKMYDMNIIDLVEINRMKDLDLKRGEKLYLIVTDQKEEIITKDVTTHDESVSEKVVKKEEVKIDKKELQSRKDIILPIKGKVTSEFGIRDGKPHKGIDIASAIGSPIFAVLDGKAVFAGSQRGYGNVVILEHSKNVMTVYAHNEANLVRIGEKVEQGQPIATLGDTGTTSGPHLHFEYRIKGKAVDPRKILPEF